MSQRTLGGGRVLGSAKAFAAPDSSLQPAILSPSASSLSLSSQASASIPNEIHDLTSRISLAHAESSVSATPAVTGAQLSCPICSEQMVTLLQLNRHIDDVHQNLEEGRQDEVKDWFKTQMDKAKRFQPLAVLNQKLKGLDVFESNENVSALPPTLPLTSRPSALPPQLHHHPEFPRPLDAEDLVTKDHWQRREPYDVCLEPSCGKRLNATNGCVNCRKCGKLFCEEHTMYQMKLLRSAQHEPVRGLWCRVCETCYKSREGYNDHNGSTRDKTDIFKDIRKQTVDKATLEVSRLEKRLTRLTQLLASLPSEQIQASGKRWPITWQTDQRKTLEQTIVSWQDDMSVPRCPFCQVEFNNYTFRRHHCRTCGRVVCGDPVTKCSSDVALSISRASKPPAEKSASLVNVDVRLCKECRTTLFDRRDFQADITRETPDVRVYENLKQFERGIRLLMPRFQRLLAAMQDPRQMPSAAQIAEASKIRQRLTSSFSQYNLAARRVRDMPSNSPTQQRLQKAVYQHASTFLHLHMLPLKSLPKILQRATPSRRLPSGGSTLSLTTTIGSGPETYQPQESASASASYNRSVTNGSGSNRDSDTSSAMSAMEAEEKNLRERLMVLEEQKFFVSEMVADANRRRKFDEVSILAVNIEDLSREIAQINELLSGLDFEGVYAASRVPA